MQRKILGGLVLTGFVLGSLAAGMQQAEASKPWTPLTKMACMKCHSSKTPKEMSDKDLTDCGKESMEVLKKAGYKRGENDAAQKALGEKFLKDFKCKK